MKKTLAELRTTTSSPESQKEEEKRFVVGVNECLKQAERDNVLAVFVDSARCVELLTNGLITICSVKSIPGVALEGLSEALTPVLRRGAVTSVAILKSKQNEGLKLVELAEKHGSVSK